MLIIIVLLIALRFVVNQSEEKEAYLYNGTYEQINNNYLNNKLYSTNSEKITLNNGILFYEKEIKYENDEENIKINEKFDYEEEGNSIIVEGKKYQVLDGNICIDSACNQNFTQNIEEKTTLLDNISINDKLIGIDSLDSVKKQQNLTFVVIVQTGCIHCEIFEQVLKSIIYDYDVKFYLLNIRKVNDSVRDEVINEYNVEATPTILMFKGGEIIDRVDSSLSKQALAELLTKKGLKNH